MATRSTGLLLVLSYALPLVTWAECESLDLDGVSGLEASCPKEPACDDYLDCGSCVAAEACAWCASDQRCLEVSAIFTRECHGTTFDAPCPTTWVPETRVVGDFILEPDGLFGGGQLHSSGTAFELVVSDEIIKLGSASDVSVAAGEVEGVNAAGGALILEAGSGDELQGGGGDMSFSAGSGAGYRFVEKNGVAGTVQVAGGAAREGTGGGLTFLGGASSTGTGGAVALITGYSQQGVSGSARLDAAGGGTLSFVTGVSSRATGDVQFATCGASSGAAGTASLAVGASGSGAGGQVILEAGRSGTSPGEITFSTGHSGDLSVTTADTSRTDGYSGSVFIKSGDSASSGEISMETGSTPQTSGSIALDTGATYHRAGADVAIESGTGHPGGDIKLEAGNASSSLVGRGGAVVVQGATAEEMGAGGFVRLQGGYLSLIHI